MKNLIGLLLAAGVLAGCGRIEEIRPAASVPVLPEAQAAAGDWPWWRGPHLDGKADSDPPPTAWSPSENIVWQADLPGRGHASPIVVGDRVITAAADDSNQTQSLLCYRRDDGRPLWTTEIHKGGFMHAHNKNSHASATPACDGQRVFCAFMVQDGLWVSATDLDGAILWQTNAGAFKSMHGYGSSPVIYKSLVIVAGDNPGTGFVAALHRESGDIVWRVQRDNKASFGTPVVATIANRDQLLLSGQGKVVSYDPASGKKLWSSRGPASTTANTMAFNDELVFASGGYPQKSVMAIRADGSGKVAWEQRLKAYVPSLLLVENRLYATQDNGIVHCFDATTGDTMWKQRLGGNFSSSPVLAAGAIYLANEAGRMFVFRDGPDFESIAENDLGGGGMATPAICGGRIYWRSASKLYCIGELAGE